MYFDVLSLDSAFRYGEKQGKTYRYFKKCISIFDAVYIDEFQDFREKDYELLIQFPQFFHEVTMVGDYYQHSVAGMNNRGIPFVEKKGNEKIPLGYLELIKKLKTKGLDVDYTTLQYSRRCSKNVCVFIRERLGIEIKSNHQEGRIITLGDKDNSQRFDPVDILKDDTIPKLLYNNASKEKKIRAINWSYAKGDTFDNICVVLTQKTEAILNKPLPKNIRPITKNKLYVALTRASGNVYLLRKDEYQEALRKIK